MDKWATLEPVRLHSGGFQPVPKSQSASSSAARFLGRLGQPKLPSQPYIGPLPLDIHVEIVSHLPLTSISSYARASRATAALCRDDKIWRKHWRSLGVEQYGFDSVLDRLENDRATKGLLSNSPATIVVEQDVIDEEDEFGAFASVSSRAFTFASSGTAFDMGGFGDAPHPMLSPPLSGTPLPTTSAPGKSSHKDLYRRAHTLLKPLLPALLSPPHVILPNLFNSANASEASRPEASTTPLRYQAQILHLLLLFLSPSLQPVLAWPSLLSSLKAAIDRFDAGLLSSFDSADRKGDEQGMKDAAWASWEVFSGNTVVAPSSRDTFLQRSGPEWEMGKVWAEKKEIFYELDRWDPIRNFTPNGGLDFRPMDEFMSYILDSIRSHGSAAVRIFPPPSGVLHAFADRLAAEVVGEYITPLLSHARGVSNEVFLKATAATFVQSWRIVEVLLEVSTGMPATPKPGVDGRKRSLPPTDCVISKIQAEDIIYRMFEPNMDEYLDEEVEAAKLAFDGIGKEWDRQLSEAITGADGKPRFLSSHNPALVKRTVLASFTDVLLLPVTIVPRTVGAVVEGARTGANAAVSGISMLNPQRWGGTGGSGSGGRNDLGGYGAANEEYLQGAAVYELNDEDELDVFEKSKKRSSVRSVDTTTSSLAPPSTSTRNTSTQPSRSASPTPSTLSKSTSDSKLGSGFDRLQLLLSLDIALEIMHACRESLKRCETFQGYPGSYGHKVRETIEELFILMLQALGEKHIQPGFAKAIEQMQTYKPAEHEETASVAPLMQFFELVHIADTMQSMVQVFFDKELAPHIDRTDFLNGVVREKKRFENTLDDSVAGGLNTGTDLLMKQVEHIILVRTGPREYYPLEGEQMELRPTKGCTEAIACLEKHCKLLKGSTNKEVLEVFYQEVGIRLDAIIQKHLKRQIISLQGGFQVIADLNAYHAFIASLKVPQITADFANLKMLGHVFIVEDAKDLAQIVRDVTRYGGSFRPEDVYEFIQRRSDWKKIERTVDKTMYNLSFKDDCVIC